MLVKLGLLDGQEQRWRLRRKTARVTVALGLGRGRMQRRMQRSQALYDSDQERTLEAMALMADVGAQVPIGDSHIDR
jgi:hypothetical protein